MVLATLTCGPPCRGRDNDLVKRETLANAELTKAAGIKPEGRVAAGEG
jgi:hypothetical protein